VEFFPHLLLLHPETREIVGESDRLRWPPRKERAQAVGLKAREIFPGRPTRRKAVSRRRISHKVLGEREIHVNADSPSRSGQYWPRAMIATG